MDQAPGLFASEVTKILNGDQRGSRGVSLQESRLLQQVVEPYGLEKDSGLGDDTLRRVGLIRSILRRSWRRLDNE